MQLINHTLQQGMLCALTPPEINVSVGPVLQPVYNVRNTVACWSSIPVKNAFSLPSDTFTTQTNQDNLQTGSPI